MASGSSSRYPQLAANDISVTPGLHGFVISRVRGDGGGWVPVKTVATWAEAIFKALIFATVTGGRVVASRLDDNFEVVDEPRRWIGPHQAWLPFEQDVVQKHVPRVPGIYALRGAAPIFVGDTENLQDRLLYHLREPLPCREAETGLLFFFETVPQPALRSERVTDLIRWWALPCNSQA
jgi:hypothetical protein